MKKKEINYGVIVIIIGVILLTVLVFTTGKDKEKPNPPVINNENKEPIGTVTGVVKEISDKKGEGSFLIEGSNVVWFTYDKNTKFQLLDQDVSIKDLKVKHIAIVEYSEALKESYPAQGHADRVIILLDQ